MTAISLSTGETVHLREKWTHKAAKAYAAARDKDVVIEYNIDGEGTATKKIPAENLENAYEAAIPFAVEKVTDKEGKEVPCTQAWLDGLDECDYRKIEDFTMQLRMKAEEIERGKKSS